MLRFADIVLLYAEALYKTGDESLARELVEEVRERACTDTDGKLNESALNAMNSAYYKTDFMEELLDERSRELCVEGWRRIDLIRTGKMTEVIGNMKTVNDARQQILLLRPADGADQEQLQTVQDLDAGAQARTRSEQKPEPESGVHADDLTIPADELRQRTLFR